MTLTMDEFDLLFSKAPAQAALLEPTPPRRFDWAGAFVLLAIVGLCSWFLLFRNDQPTDPDDIDSDTSSGSLVVFVFEHKTKSIEQDEILRGMSDFVAEKKLSGFRCFDSDSSDAKPFVSFAEKKKVSIPAMFLVRDKSIRKAAPYPASRKELEVFVK